jgi:hypothetical protein
MTDQSTTDRNWPRHGAEAQARKNELRGPRLLALRNWMQANDGRSPSLDDIKVLWGYKSKSTALYYVRYLVAQYDLFVMPNEGRVNQGKEYIITPQGLKLAEGAGK